MKKIYTKCDKATGEILSILSKLDSELTEDFLFIEGEYPSSLYRIVDGSPIKKSSEELDADDVLAATLSLRRLRDGLLKDSDWTQVPDAPVDHAAWAAYRQALRDLPANTVDPRHPDWPTPPA